jgi:hypothetical protein
MKQLRAAIFLLSLIIAGCASQQPRIPAKKIRGRADRAFDELKAEEARHGAVPRETKRKGAKGSSDTKPKGVVKVTQGKRPNWVNGESARYPSSEYLIGIGYGPDRRSAEDNARCEIAKIFYSKVDSQTRIYQEYLQTTTKGRSVETESLDIEQITEVSTQKVLSGVRISQVYQEIEPEPTFYALAVLDRSQSAAALRHKILELDRDIQRLLTNAVDEEDVIIKISHFKESVHKHILREAYNAELCIVSHSGRGIPSPIHFTQIKSQLKALLLKDFLVGLWIKGMRAEEVRESLLQGLNQRGFSVCEDLNRANVVVRATIEIDPLDRGSSEWKYVQWRTHLDLADQRRGVVFGSVNETGREGHTSLVGAEDRAVRTIRNSLATGIAKELTQYIFSR